MTKQAMTFYKHDIEGVSILIPVPELTQEQKTENVNLYGLGHGYGVNTLPYMYGMGFFANTTHETITIADAKFTKDQKQLEPLEYE